MTLEIYWDHDQNPGVLPADGFVERREGLQSSGRKH